MQSEDANKWEDAIREEYESLTNKGIWELAPLLKHRKSIGCKWMFCTKKNELGENMPHKARLIAKRYSQVYGVDFNETFVLVAKF